MLQEQTVDHFRAISQIRVRMNSLLPVACLPPEILGQILICLAAKEPTRYTVRGSHHHWLEVTHVCHSWREVALNTPRLWSDIEIGSSSIDCVEAFLTRSKHAPLHIRGYPPYAPQKWIPIIRRIIEECTRAETIALTLSEPIYEDILGHLPSSMPLLRTLEISYTKSEDNSSPIPFVNCATPALRELTVALYRFEWAKDFIPRSLTHLRITYLSYTTSAPCSEVAAAISNLPELRQLVLKDVLAALPESTSQLPPARHTITLPHLEEIHLSASALACVHFLEHCELPASTKILLSFRAMCSDSTIPLLVSPLLHKLDASIVDDGKQAVRQFWVLHRTLCFIKGRKRDGALLPQTHLRISLSGNVSANGISLLLEKLCVHFPLCDASTLVIGDSFGDIGRGSAWMKLLDVMKNVECLQFAGTHIVAEDIIPVLRACAAAQDGQTQPVQRYFVPKLKRLNLFRIRFREPEKIGNDEFEFVCGLVDAFRSRKVSSVTTKIVVQQCINMDQNDVAILRECEGVSVSWDGLEDFEDCPQSDSQFSEEDQIP